MKYKWAIQNNKSGEAPHLLFYYIWSHLDMHGWDQRITEAVHNWPIPKFFGNSALALAAEVFGATIGLVIY